MSVEGLAIINLYEHRVIPVYLYSNVMPNGIMRIFNCSTEQMESRSFYGGEYERSCKNYLLNLDYI